MKLVIAAAIALAAAVPVAAQTSAPPDPAALAAARQLLIESDFNGQMERTATLTSAATFETVLREAEARAGTAMPAELRARIQAIVDAELRDMMARLKKTAMEEAAGIYARYFTAAEIAQIREFQLSQTGRKMQQVTPALVAELSQIGVREASSRTASLQMAIREEVEQWAKSRPTGGK